MYFDSVFNDFQYLIPKFFPKNHSENLVICYGFRPDMGMFDVLITDMIPDLGLMVPAPNQCFPLYTYEDDARRENITDVTLKEYKEHYGYKEITKLDVFYYVYGMLHHQQYRKKYANNLSRELPHIPMAPDFWGFSKIGKKLADLHLSWETCQRYNLGKPKVEFGKYKKMAFDRIKKNGKLDTGQVRSQNKWNYSI